MEDLTYLLPFIVLEVVEESGGRLELDAKSIQAKLDSSDIRLAVSMTNSGKLVIEIDEGYEGSASEQASKTTKKS